jgi:hypothetical protein
MVIKDRKTENEIKAQIKAGKRERKKKPVPIN